MPNISDFRTKLNARMAHIIDKNTQKILRDLLDYAEGLEKKVTLRLPQQFPVLLGPKDIPDEQTEASETGGDEKRKKSKTKEQSPKVAAPQQPSILLGPKDIQDDDDAEKSVAVKAHASKSSGQLSRSATKRSADTGDDKVKVSPPQQPKIVLGPKGAKPVGGKKA